VASGEPDEGSGSVTVQFQLTREEVVPIVRWSLTQTYITRRTVVATAFSAVIGILLIRPVGIPAIGWALLALATAEVLLLCWLYATVPVRAWKKMSPDRGSTTLVFTDEGVGVHTTNIDAEQRWAVYSETIELDRLYILKRGSRRSFQVVPKRSFGAPDDEERFRSLVTQHTESRLIRSPASM
jgi:hypothetical protein